MPEPWALAVELTFLAGSLLAVTGIPAMPTSSTRQREPGALCQRCREALTAWEQESGAMAGSMPLATSLKRSTWEPTPGPSLRLRACRDTGPGPPTTAQDACTNWEETWQRATRWESPRQPKRSTRNRARGQRSRVFPFQLPVLQLRPELIVVLTSLVATATAATCRSCRCTIRCRTVGRSFNRALIAPRQSLSLLRPMTSGLPYQHQAESRGRQGRG